MHYFDMRNWLDHFLLGKIVNSQIWAIIHKHFHETIFSDVYPHIPRPISTISLRSSVSEHRPNVFDTFSATKLSQLFDGRKSSLPSRINYFDFQSSPQLGHKEYLDFNEIENILVSKYDRPKKETALTGGRGQRSVMITQITGIFISDVVSQSMSVTVASSFPIKICLPNLLLSLF